MSHWFPALACQSEMFPFIVLRADNSQLAISSDVRERSPPSSFFEKIVIFFTHDPSNFALLQVHPVLLYYSDAFQASDSYFLLKKPLDRLFFRLSFTALPELEACPLDTHLDHCIVSTPEKHLILR